MESKAAESLVISDENYNEMMKKQISSRLQRRDQSRAVESEKKRAAREESKVQEEKSSFFTKHFEEELNNLQNMIRCDGFSPSDRSLLLEHFDAITISYQRLQKFYNDSVMFLPRFALRKAQQQLAELQESINQKRTEMLPKKKFAFKSKSKTANNSTNGKDIPQVKEAAAQKFASRVAEMKQDCEVKHKKGATLTLEEEEVNKKDVSLSHLEDCKINIHGAPGTVHISDVANCSFVIGPVSGSVFVERCANSTVATGCQQLRVHETKATDFYLHVTSRAIIEDTTSIRVAPYNVSYPGMDKHFLLSGLDRDVNNWTAVDDFNWLAMDTPSPNWSVIAEDDRQQQC